LSYFVYSFVGISFGIGHRVINKANKNKTKTCMPIYKINNHIHDHFSQNGKPETETFHKRKDELQINTNNTSKTHTCRREKRK